MTKKEAIKVIDGRFEIMDYCESAKLEEALDIAIKVLKQPERKKGKWIPMFDGQFKGGAYWFSCSECGRVVPDIRNGWWSFCPNCGSFNGEGEQNG